MRHRRSLALAVGLLVAGVSGGVGYAKVVSNHSSNVIYACVNRYGSPRLVSSRTPCSRYETRTSWNRQGEAGPPGAPGEPGAPGAPGAPGEPGAPGTTTAAWYRSVSLEGGAAIPVPVTLPPNGHAPLQVSVDLPAKPVGGGYLMSVTFGLRNSGPVDAEVVCAVGNVMAHQFFAPVSDQTAGQEVLGGVYGSDTRTYTIAGAYTGDGTVGLSCGLTSWTGMGDPADPAQAPTVVIKGAFLSAQRIDVLTDQS